MLLLCLHHRTWPAALCPTGTVLYYFSYMVNERWRGRPGLPLVIAANSVWIVAPAFGMWACYQLIATGTYDLFRN